VRHGYLVHAPGEISVVRESPDGVAFAVNGWPRKPYWVLINGVRAEPEIKINGAPNVKASPHYEYSGADGQLILQLVGNAIVELMQARPR
jgi:hypothetical protein